MSGLLIDARKARVVIFFFFFFFFFVRRFVMVDNKDESKLINLI